ncbi:HesB/YadR/YfhF family protein [Filibacter tadaridae]|uniref:Iron-sulfur cluster biosynthesis n=1 Tax=Filibacter tadaridae TaxID=2483811 RepID=A0A3P5XDI5_9BACL|nr:HesB/YadR/YfhF family protein [Filibacter tadaridae]VDC28912.1 Iron-sulfur cluster biosynthesis [Filibacter tadaridae]
MKIIVSDEAQSWFQEEMDAKTGDCIKFFARYGGSSALHEGFSLGVMKEQPDETAVKVVHNGVIYYIEQRDEWYFLDHDLHITVNPELDELVYTYEKA